MRRKPAAPPEKILLRVAIYIRVSTDRQAKEGDSMRDQLATGQKYIDSHENMILVDTYIDDGISGQKLTRDDFQRLLDDVRSGKIDLIIFTRLDRWFRNLRHYLNTQDILDRHGVSWTAIEQPYFDTSTPHGRAFVNNSMIWAELEAQNDSDRILGVFDDKVDNGEVLSGSTPLGYSIKDKHLSPDDDAPTAVAIFQYYRRNGNLSATLRHIVINSLRKYDVERQDFMERACDSRAGYKHHVSKDYLTHLKRSLMDICHREHLHQVDLLAPAEKKITDREYRAKRRGQKKLDERNSQILADGLTPRKTVFQTQKEFLRTAIEEAAASSCSLEEFQRLLMEKYSIKLKTNRSRFSYLHPERSKYITDSAPEQEESMAILFVRSDLRLVTDLQTYMKAQQSAAYANKVKLSNLKEMAKTVAYIQEHGYDTRDSLEDSFSEIKNHASGSRKDLKSVEDKLRKVNEQIHYTGQYLANKSVYQQFCKSKNKGQFRKEHTTEIALYEAARKFLKGQSADGRLPSMKLLKAEKDNLLLQKKEAQKTYHYYRDYQKELDTVCSNVDMILGRPHSRQTEKEKGTDIS